MSDSNIELEDKSTLLTVAENNALDELLAGRVDNAVAIFNNNKEGTINLELVLKQLVYRVIQQTKETIQVLESDGFTTLPQQLETIVRRDCREQGKNIGEELEIALVKLDFMSRKMNMSKF